MDLLERKKIIEENLQRANDQLQVLILSQKKAEEIIFKLSGQRELIDELLKQENELENND